MPILSVALLAALPAPQGLPYAYVEVGAERGILPFPMASGMSAGLAAEDFDGDGDTDLFVPTALGTPDRLYRNDGSGHFDEVAGALGLASLENHRAGLWLDVDGDGDQDLVVAGDGSGDSSLAPESSLRLWEQLGDGSFVDRTQAAGLFRDLLPNEDTHLGGLAAGDLNGDGHLDLYVCYWEGLAHLYWNDGQGGFVDGGLASGVQEPLPFWQPVLFDLDRDGHMDIFQAVDFLPNRLWQNQGDGTFLDVAPQAGVDNAFNEMGVALGDFGGDGLLDLYITNQHGPGEYNLLYRRLSQGLAFEEVSAPMNVQDSGIGWGAVFFDADLDGNCELAASNDAPGADSRFFARRPGGDSPYVDVAAKVGFTDSRGTGLVALDIEGDGDLDLAQVSGQGQLRLFENRLTSAPDRGYLIVRPRMSGANPRAIGSTVSVLRPGRRPLLRPILAGSSILSQEPAQAHFGIGAAAEVDVVIDWPDGSRSSLRGVGANTTVTVNRP